jgi:ABC-type glycerol-3-phosphate transport system permease component
MPTHQNKEEKMVEEKPPILSNWNQLYAIVFINMIVMIVLFYIFTKIFG